MQRVLNACPDPFSMYAKVQRDGEESLLFESPDGRALLMAKAALRLECRGSFVTLRALSPNGRSLLSSLEWSLGARKVFREGDKLLLEFALASGLDAEERLLAESPLDAIRAALGSDDDDSAQVLGIIGFDYALLSEEMAANAEDPFGFPDYLFWVPESLVSFAPNTAPYAICVAFSDQDESQSRRNHYDSVQRLTELVALAANARPLADGRSVGADVEADVDIDDDTFMDMVEQLKREIAAGEVYQIVPSRTFSAPCSDPARAHAALRAIEPISYRFFVQGQNFALFGASPESSVRVYLDEGAKQVEVRPIAGTRPRGETPDQDDRLELDLRLDEKECAEHVMLIDLARNDVGRISAPGTRRAAKLMTVERYARVMHLISSVTGRLADGLDALHALTACLNVGTLSGAPKIRACELLRQVERSKRGPYGGAIGWLNSAGEMETAVVIRSAFVRDGVAHVRAGAGIVFDSDPQAEADETRRKAAAVLSVLGAGKGS